MINKLIDRKKDSILIFLPKKDFSEDEYLIIRNVFLKAGKQIFITSDDYFVCSGNKGMKVKSDTNFYNINVKNFIALILIGGSGSRDYWNKESLHKIIKMFSDEKKVVGAICTATVILAKAGILHDKKSTCFSEDKMELINAGIDYQDKRVVVDGNIISADYSHSAHQFAETILHLTK